MGCLHIIAIVLWVLSLVMMFVNFAIGWVVLFILTTIYLMIVGGTSGGIGFDFLDFD